jgi:hypothetical protein
LSASADWSANKYITLPDKRGYVPGGLDDMGNSAAGRFANVPIISGTVTTPGAIIGEAVHTLVAAEVPKSAYTATTSVTLTGLPTSLARSTNTGGFQPGTAASTFLSGTASGGDTTNLGATATTTITNASGDGTHNTVQKTVLGTFYRKL